MSLSSRIFLGLALGVATGLFFGEMVSFLSVVGRGFIALLQMTVLPYITVSLIAGLGSLDYKSARLLARRGGAVLLVLWSITLGVVFLASLAFPTIETANFFSASLITDNPDQDLLPLYIPANPFHAMANTLIPGIILFSLLVGVALIGIPKKDRVIEPFKVFGHALMRVNQFVVQLMPFGIFAISASTAGTLGIEEFGRLQVYLVTYIVAALILSLLVLPGLVAAITPFRYRDIIGSVKDILLMAFVTGSLFAVLPLLIERSKEFISNQALEGDDTDSLVDVIVPAAFNFPHSGKLLSLVFVLFAGWFTESALTAEHVPEFALSGLAVSFGAMHMAIPFLLDQFQIPADMYQLFLATSVINRHFSALLGAVHTFAISLVGICAIYGALNLKPVKLVRFALLTVVLFGVSTGALRLLFTHVLEFEYHKDDVIAGMRIQERAGRFNAYEELPPPLPQIKTGQTRLQAIRERGFIRVGYLRSELPFSFINATDDLVGLDIELTHRLATGLDVDLELVPIDGVSPVAALDSNLADIIMPVAITPEYAEQVLYSLSVREETAALATKDFLRQEFQTIESLRDMPNLQLGIDNVPYYIGIVRELLPDASITIVSSEQFFSQDGAGLDGYVTTAEAGSAWSLLYPQFTVLVPRPGITKVPVAFALPANEFAMQNTINAWIALKRGDGTLQALNDYWIMGKNADHKGPRWSVIRDVLGWVK